MQACTVFVIGDDRFFGSVESESFAFRTSTLFGDIIQTEYHVLRRHRDRRAVGRVQDVVRTEHQQLGLQNGCIAQRQVHGHLVAVEVGVEGGTSQRVQLQGLALDQFGLESLDTEPVQGRCTVHQYRVAFDHVLEDIPDHRVFAVDNLLGRFNGLDNTAFDQLADDERLVQLGCHVFRNTHLVHLQLGADDDYRTGRIVDTFTEQVLAETSLFTLQTIRKRFERAVRFRLHGIAFARVVEQGIHGLLQHAFLVAQDDIRCFDFDQPFQTVVTDNHATVQVVQVGSGETAAVQRNEGTQFWRDHGDHLEDHPLGFIHFARFAECFHNVQALECFGLALLRGLRAGLVAQRIGELVEVHALQQRVDRFGAHHGDELVRVGVVELLVAFGQSIDDIEVLFLCQQVEFGHAVHSGGSRLNHYVTFVVNDRFEFLGRDPQQVADFRGQRTEIPDMRYRNDQRNVPHTFAAHLLLGHFHAATVADDAFVADTLVLAAMAFVVFDRTENALAKEAVAFRLVRTVVYRLRLEDLSARIFQNLLGRCQTNRNLRESALCLVVFLE